MAAETGYDAFISYSHLHDGALAPKLQAKLERFAKPWYRMRALRVFCDTANLAANPELWASIENALATSRWFVLLASAEAAKSSYVNREVRWWLEHRSADHMLVVGTSPGLAWDEQLGDWAVTAPVPPALRGSRPGGEPRWVNMSDLGSGDGREPRIPADGVAELAAPLRGMDKDELIGEHVKYRRRTLFTVTTAVVALAVLAVVALGFAGAASHQRVVAFSAALATQSEQLEVTNPSLAAQLLLTAYHLDPQSQDLAWRLIGTESQTLSAAENVGGTFDTLGGAVAFSPDGTTLATVGDGRNAVMLWSVGTAAGPRRLGQPLTISNSGAVDSVAFSPDGTTLAAATAELGNNGIGAVILWNISNPARPRQISLPLTIGNVSGVYSLTFSPDGKTLAVAAGPFIAGGNTVTLWNVSDPAHPRQISQPIIPGNSRVLDSVAFSPNGTILAVAATNSAETVTLWSLSNPARLRQLSQPLTISSDAGVDSLAFSPDGKTLAVGTRGGGDTGIIGAVTLWSLSDPAHLRQISQPLTIGSGSFGYSVAFSPDGTTLAAGASASDGGTVTLWDISNPAHPRQISQLLTADTGTLVGSLAFSPDGTTLAAGSSGGTLTLWSLPSAALPASTTGNGSTADSVAFSPNGTTLAVGTNDSSGSGTVTLWNLSSPTRPHQLSRPLTADNNVGSVAFSPDSKTLAVGDLDSSHPGAITLWNLSNPAHPRQISQFGQPPPSGFTTLAETMNSVAFSPDGTTLAVGADGGTVTLWNLSNPADPVQPVAIGNSGPVNAVAFSPDGTTLAVGTYEGLGGTDTVTLWNLSNPAHPRRLAQPFTVGITSAAGYVNSVAFSPNGTTLAVGTSSSIADTVTLWDVSNPGHPRQLSQPLTADSGNAVESVAFSRDGTTLAAADGDAVALWDVSNPAAPQQLGQPLATGNGSPVDSVAFSPDGTTLVAGDSDGAQVWNRNIRSAIGRICDLTAGELTPQQWSQYIPQLPYDPPCSNY
jgi:WD40 repeat protein